MFREITAMSKSSFPPKTNNEDQVAAMVEVLRSVIPDKNAVYISIPLTSGRRFMEWRAECNGADDKNGSLSGIIEANRTAAKFIVEELRNDFSEVIIDPLALPDIKDWDQNDYRDFWGRVVERYAKTVVCTKDWSYSSGCAYEFLVAKRNRILTVDEKNDFISAEEGAKQINISIQELKKYNLSACFLENVITALNEIKFEEEVCIN